MKQQQKRQKKQQDIAFVMGWRQSSLSPKLKSPRTLILWRVVGN